MRTNNPPRISIVLPARDAAPTLPACLRSIARQTERSWECIIVDDGSIDETARIARLFADHDPRFRVVTTPPCGLIAALNEGLRHCRAPLVARMDADDLMHRRRLRVQAEALDHDAMLSAVGSRVRLFPRRSLSPRLREYEEWLNGLQSAADVRRDAFIECPVAHPTLMMRRDIAADGYVDRGWPEDYDLVLRALSRGHRIAVVPERLTAWRNGPNSLSRRDLRYAQDRFTACKAHFLSIGFLAAHATYVLWGYGGTGRTLRRALAAHGRVPSHIVEVKRSRIGQRIHGAEVVPDTAITTLRGRRIVVSVARAGPRSIIRTALARAGFVEGEDFVCAA
ncbi:MAG: glycosyltransferase family 2 protein [Vicinamibacterales bacterium]